MANEKRLIDANYAVKLLRGKCVAKYPNIFLMGLLAAATEIEQAPTVDAVEVVRCKDCDNTCPGTIGLVCTMWGSRTPPDGWCYMGERREGE